MPPSSRRDPPRPPKSSAPFSAAPTDPTDSATRCAPHGPVAPAGAVDELRRDTVEVLCEAFANDELDVEEFERRIDLAHRTSERDALLRLRSGLVTRASAPPSPRPEVSPDAVPARDLVCAFCGGATRRGNRVAPATSWVVAALGGVELDFREARFGPGVTDVHALALMGGVDIVVPPGVRVECHGAAVLGGFDHDGDPPGDRPAGTDDAPVLRVRGLACMGGVAVSVRRPGESAREAKRRRRAARDGAGADAIDGGGRKRIADPESARREE